MSYIYYVLSFLTGCKIMFILLGRCYISVKNMLRRKHLRQGLRRAVFELFDKAGKHI